MALMAQSVSVHFGGVVALSDITVGFESGVVSGVVGPNGSGKTTLFNALAGFVRLAEGTVVMDEQPLDRLRPYQRLQPGILARTLQTPRSDPDMTVRESILCGFYGSLRAGMLRSMLRTPAVRRGEARARRQVDDIIGALGLGPFADMRVGGAPIGIVRLTDVGRAMAADPKYLLLDEPAAGLDEEERARLAAKIVDVARSGVGVVLIEHNFPLIRLVCDVVTVLNNGEQIAHGTPGEVSRDPQVVDAYLGKGTHESTSDDS